MSPTITQAIATQDNSPASLVKKYEAQITAALPSHINHEQWIAVALGALRKNPELAAAAANSPGAFMSTMMTASRLGLEPGTEQFHLIAQSPRKGESKEITGIVGWEGLVELIYRAGAVSSVIAELVYTLDGFEYQPGINDKPIHTIDWNLDNRGDLKLAYAYCIMKDGATSKVVVYNKADIARVRAKSRSANYENSPWRTDEPSMWRKSVVRQLAKWVPTSAEYRKEQLRAAQQVMAEQHDLPPMDGDEIVDLETGEVVS